VFLSKGDIMTAKKPTSDEQFEYDGPKTTLDELFDHHGYQVYEGHHPDREGLPKWILDVGNQYFHKTVTIVQRMKATPENVTVIHNLIMALEWEYLIKRCILDQEEELGAEVPAVKKAILERIRREHGE
jgi:hypothetical protein